jgi:hypothetical protein
VAADTPMITRDMVAHAKPDPDLFLAAAALLDVEPRHAYVVGDSVWDLLAARRAQSIGIGLMSGGYGREELERAGAYRVYADPPTCWPAPTSSASAASPPAPNEHHLTRPPVAATTASARLWDLEPGVGRPTLPDGVTSFRYCTTERATA